MDLKNEVAQILCWVWGRHHDALTPLKSAPTAPATHDSDDYDHHALFYKTITKIWAILKKNFIEILTKLLRKSLEKFVEILENFWEWMFQKFKENF